MKDKGKWNRNHKLKFINLVKAKPCLYDNEDPDYHCSEEKREVWEQICTAMGYGDAQLMKSRWKNLRDSLRVSIKKVQKKNPDATINDITCPVIRRLSFVLPYLRNTDPNHRSDADTLNNKTENSVTHHDMSSNDKIKLINLVQQNPCLYDNTVRSYNDKDMKAEVWEKIAGEMGYGNGQEMKYVFKIFRDIYRSSLRNSIVKGGNAKYKFAPHMKFMQPFIKFRTLDMSHKPAPSKSDNTTKELSDSDNSWEEQTDIPVEAETISEFIFSDEEDEQHGDEEESDNEILAKYANSEPLTHRKNIQVSKSTDESLNNPVAEGSKDSLQLFYNSMYEATKKMPANWQLRVRRKVFEIVSNAEEQLLVKNPFVKLETI